jgi:alpha-L-fucosidase
VYDWQSYYRLIRELQPDAVIAVMGPDVRWVGTESGYGRETEWSVLPDVAQNLDAIAAGSQQDPVDGAFVPQDVMGADLGSREKIKSAKALVWYPSEVDVSIRPGWFYHADQDNQVKTAEKLVDIYYSSVGRNSVLLLNVPPDKRGLVHENDVRSLKGMRTILDRTFATDLVSGAAVGASDERPGREAAFAVDADNGTYWETNEGVTSASLEVSLPSARTFDRAMLQECIREGQRVERFHIDAWDGATWTQVAQGTTIGYKRLLRFPAVTAAKVRLVIDESRTSPTLSTFGLYKAPPRVTIEPGGGAFEDSMTVRLSSDSKGVAIHYTLDGTAPTLRSPRYTGPIVLTRTATLTALPAEGGELGMEPSEARFLRCKRVAGLAFEKQYSPRYAGHGHTTLSDGHRGSAGFDDGKWLGFDADDMTATLDLGKPQPIRKVTAGFLQQQGSWIFLPTRVTCSVSADGKSWKTLAEVTYPLVKSAEVAVRDCAFDAGKSTARYIRVVARNVGTCPAWHEGAGSNAWLFVDEIFVE